MNPEYTIVLIQTLTTILAAIISGLFAIAANRQHSANAPVGEPTKTTTRPVWLWITMGALIGIVLSQFVGLFGGQIWQLLGGTVSEKRVQVSATADWQTTGVYVHKGERLRITAGNEEWYPQGSYAIDADGTGSNIYSSEIGLNASLGSLIAKYGENGSPFVVGKNRELVVDGDGHLLVRIHDGNLKDNRGSINIVIKVWR
jgi:hypothetical protein